MVVIQEGKRQYSWPCLDPIQSILRENVARRRVPEQEIASSSSL